MELRAGGGEREGGAGLEREGEGEGVRGSAGTEHLAVQGESFAEAGVLGELSQAGVPWGGRRGGRAAVGLRGFRGGGGRRRGAPGEDLLLGALPEHNSASQLF